MANLSPGVAKVRITLVVSAVRAVSKANCREIGALISLISSSSWLEFKALVWKGNVGRDFSSAHAGLSQIMSSAGEHDYVMVRNRSAYGPFLNDWYALFVSQYNRFPNLGLVGNTINLIGPIDAPESSTPHIQTYIYLSQWKVFSALLECFPGLRSHDYDSAILTGEIGLSQEIFAMSLMLSSLYWPDRCIGADLSQQDDLPHRDIKSEATGLPFRYKFPAYRRSRQAMLRRTLWYFRTHFSLPVFGKSAATGIVVNDFGQVNGHVSR